MIRFFERLKESVRKLREELERQTEEIRRLRACLDNLNGSSLYDRRFPPYREKLNPRGYTRRIFWHRIRSNPHRKRKPHRG